MVSSENEILEMQIFKPAQPNFLSKTRTHRKDRPCFGNGLFIMFDADRSKCLYSMATIVPKFFHPSAALYASTALAGTLNVQALMFTA
jgi:hypothetical protein